MSLVGVRDLLAGLGSDRAGVRLAAAKALCESSHTEPVRLYPHFDRILALLRQPNQILQWNGMRILANLAPVDRAGLIDGILEEYLAPIAGRSMIGAAEAIAGAAAIAVAKPRLADAIAERILLVEGATYATPECRNVAIGHALRAAPHLVPLLKDTAAWRAFALRQTENPRPATRRKAQRLLELLDRPAAHPARPSSRMAPARRPGVQ